MLSFIYHQKNESQNSKSECLFLVRMTVTKIIQRTKSQTTNNWNHNNNNNNEKKKTNVIAQMIKRRKRNGCFGPDRCLLVSGPRTHMTTSVVQHPLLALLGFSTHVANIWICRNTQIHTKQKEINLRKMK